MSLFNADFLVVGAGIAGLSLASELASRSRAKVLVLEQEDHPGYHATGRSAAILVEEYSTPLVRRLTALSRPMLDGEGVPSLSVLRPRGILYLALKGAADALTVAEGGSVRRISAETAAGMVPALDADAIDHAFHDPTAADIDVHALQTRRLESLRAHGGQLLAGAAVTAAERVGGRWRVAAGEHRIDAGVVIDAAGAWARQVAGLFAAQDIALIPCRRSAAIVVTDTDEDTSAWPMVVDLGETVYFKPEGGRLMISPADETPSPPCDATPDDLDIAYAVDRFEHITRRKVRRVTHRWAGLRTFAPDRNPVLGHDAQAPGFFWLAGQGGIGVQTAPIMARIAADLLLDARSPAVGEAIDLTSLSPRRFP